jgi:exodeoxyribonuclease X
VHHISPEEVAGLIPFDATHFVHKTMALDVFAAHNYAFEAKWIGEALAGIPTLCTYKAALRVWPDAPSHSNGALRYWLQDQKLIAPVAIKTMPPHRAAPDAYVTAWLLKALLETGTTGKEMVAWTKEPALLPAIPIGKQRGAKWPDVETGFLRWMLAQATMEPDLKWNAQRELDRRAA